MRTRASRMARDSLHTVRAGQRGDPTGSSAEDPARSTVRRQLYWTWSRGGSKSPTDNGDGELLGGVSLALVPGFQRRWPPHSFSTRLDERRPLRWQCTATCARLPCPGVAVETPFSGNQARPSASTLDSLSSQLFLRRCMLLFDFLGVWTRKSKTTSGDLSMLHGFSRKLPYHGIFV